MQTDLMIFPDDHPASPMNAWSPVLRGLYRFQPIQFPDALQPGVNELPGAGPVGSHFAPVFPGTAAGTVEHMLCASGYGADAAVLMEDAAPAGDAFLRPGGPFFEDADEFRIETGINRFVVPLGQGLHAGAASQRKNDVISLDRLGGLFQEDVVALAFERQFLQFQTEILQPGMNAQRGRDDADFPLATGEADGHAGAATDDEHLLAAFQNVGDFGDTFSLCDNHMAISCFSAEASARKGFGPSIFRIPNKSLMLSTNGLASAAETLIIRIRSGSRPLSARNFRA